MNVLKTLIEMAGYETHSYSGRGMYGEKCLGVTTDDSESEFWANVLENVDQRELPTVVKEMHRTKADSMGHSSVLYFPTVPFADGNERDDSGDPCDLDADDDA